QPRRGSRWSCADPPTLRMPMTATGEVARLAHDPVGAPRHDVGGAGLDVEFASRAAVELHGGRGALRLHVPIAVALVLHALQPAERALEIERLVLRQPATRAAGADHVPMLRNAARAEPGQYQP